MSEPLRILLVDGDDNHRALYRIVLADEGYDVREASTRSEAAEVAHLRRPDLIVLDTRLASSNGAGPLPGVTDHPSLAETPLILVAPPGAVPDSPDRLVRPLDPQRLLASVAHHLRQGIAPRMANPSMRRAEATDPTGGNVCSEAHSPSSVSSH